MRGTKQVKAAVAALALLGAAALPYRSSLRADEPPRGTSWQEQAVLKGNPNGARALAFALDGKSLANLSQDGVVTIWDAVRGKEQATLKGGRGQILGIACPSGGKTLVTVGEDGFVREWDASTGRERQRARLPLRDAVVAGSFSPDGKLLATAGIDGAVHVWSLAKPAATPDAKP
jgi:WD40 repeat protein